MASAGSGPVKDAGAEVSVESGLETPSDDIVEALEREFGPPLARRAAHDQQRADLIKLVMLFNAGAGAGTLAVIGAILGRSASGTFPQDLLWTLLFFVFGTGIGAASFGYHAKRAELQNDMRLDTAMTLAGVHKVNNKKMRRWRTTPEFASQERRIDSLAEKARRGIHVSALAGIIGIVLGLAALWSRAA